MITTHLVFFRFFIGAGVATPATKTIKGQVTHAGIYAFFDGFSPASAVATVRKVSGMLAAQHVRRKINHGRH